MNWKSLLFVSVFLTTLGTFSGCGQNYCVLGLGQCAAITENVPTTGGGISSSGALTISILPTNGIISKAGTSLTNTLTINVIGGTLPYIFNGYGVGGIVNCTGFPASSTIGNPNNMTCTATAVGNDTIKFIDSANPFNTGSVSVTVTQ